MECVKCFLCLILVGMLCVSVKTEEGDNDLTRSVTLECRNATHNVVNDMMSILRHCINASTSIPVLSDDEDQYRLYASTFCQHSLPSLRECLAEEDNRWSRCENETRTKVFGIFREMVETTLQNTCEEQGFKLYKMIYGYERHTRDFRARNPVVRECLIFGSIKLRAAMTSQAELPSKLWYVHHLLHSFRNCLLKHIHGDDGFVSLAQEEMNATLDAMKCLHPEDESIILCKDVDTGLIDRAGLCPIKTKSELLVPLNFLVENRATGCFSPWHDLYGAKLSEADTIEKFREYFKKYCRHQDRVKDCMSQTAFVADICLDESGVQMLQLIRQYLELALEAGCFEEGRRLVTVMHNAHVMKSSPNQSEPMLSCLFAAQAKREKATQDPARIYGYYQELPIIKNCLLNKVKTDTSFQTDVSEFIDFMMENMKCFDPRDGSVVLCKTIVNS